MARSGNKHHYRPRASAAVPRGVSKRGWILAALGAVAVTAALYVLLKGASPAPLQPAFREPDPVASPGPITGWTERALAVTRLFHRVYTPCWEGAYGAIGTLTFSR